MDDAALRVPDRKTGRVGLYEGLGDEGQAVLIKVWPRSVKQDDRDIEAIWRHEMRQLHRMTGHPDAHAVIAKLHDAGEDTVNVTHEAFNRRPQAMAHGEVLGRAVGLDMAAAGWTPTADNYLGRVTKPRILEAVRDAKGEMAAQLIDHLKKVEMAKEAERLLAGSGWLPEPLRIADDEPTPGIDGDEAAGGEPLPAFLVDEDELANDDRHDPEPLAIAAE